MTLTAGGAPGPRRYVEGIGLGPDDLDEPWAGADDPAVVEALAGKAILLAHRAADDTLAEAARRAALVLSEAEARAAGMVQRAQATAAALIAEAQDSIAEVFGARTDEILALLSRSHRTILDALKGAEAELSHLASSGSPPRASAAADLHLASPVSDFAGWPTDDDDDHSTPEARLAAIRAASRRAAARAASEGRFAQARALQRTHAPFSMPRG